jgi:putative photosynthetic complex assembly protein
MASTPARSHIPPPGASVVESRLIRIDQGADGRITVSDVSTGKAITDAAPGAEGFLRGALRGLNRIRMAGETQPSAPYLLERMANGQILLTDTGSGVSLDLNAYGRSNAAVFAEFLEPTGDKS